jgi:ketosteroid isomerase-like protein
MKQMLAFVLLLLVAGSGGVPARQAAAEDEKKALVQLIQDMHAAQVRNDLPFLDRVVADDCVIIHANGDLLTKAQWMADKRTGATRWQSLQPAEIQVRVYGKTAVAHNRMIVNGRLRGAPFAGQTRQSSAFVKDQGRWRFVLIQFTTIPKP